MLLPSLLPVSSGHDSRILPKLKSGIVQQPIDYIRLISQIMESKSHASGHLRQ